MAAASTLNRDDVFKQLVLVSLTVSVRKVCDNVVDEFSGKFGRTTLHLSPSHPVIVPSCEVDILETMTESLGVTAGFTTSLCFTSAPCQQYWLTSQVLLELPRYSIAVPSFAPLAPRCAPVRDWGRDYNDGRCEVTNESTIIRTASKRWCWYFHSQRRPILR